jgi:hypothetical protein
MNTEIVAKLLAPPQQKLSKDLQQIASKLKRELPVWARRRKLINDWVDLANQQLKIEGDYDEAAKNGEIYDRVKCWLTEPGMKELLESTYKADEGTVFVAMDGMNNVERRLLQLVFVDCMTLTQVAYVESALCRIIVGRMRNVAEKIKSARAVI